MIINACSLIALQFFPDNHFDSIITDPPYELGFMGKSWDATGIAYNVQLWREALRVLKPGGHLLAFSGSRTYHRMTCAIEDAGFEVRDQIMWLYGSGFPKSLDVSKAIDKAAGVEREVVGIHKNAASSLGNGRTMDGGKAFEIVEITAPSTEAARQWNGWGTALKPAHEPICVARKPLTGTVAANVLQYGTGALNIDASRVGNDLIKIAAKGRNESFAAKAGRDSSGSHKWNGCEASEHLGRWPANVIHDGTVEFPNAKGAVSSVNGSQRSRGTAYGEPSSTNVEYVARIDSDTSAARFFYCAKASKSDRDEGNIHPTVKPTALMQYLCTLVTPPGGHILDPFAGSGSTGKAAKRSGFQFTGIERDPEYAAIAEARINT
jgi:DNA modification methylase